MPCADRQNYVRDRGGGRKHASETWEVDDSDDHGPNELSTIAGNGPKRNTNVPKRQRGQRKMPQEAKSEVASSGLRFSFEGEERKTSIKAEKTSRGKG